MISNFNNKDLNLKSDNNNTNSYYISIKDNNNHTFTETYITEEEFNVIRMAIKYNNGVINLLNHKEEIYSLYRKGLVEISDNELELVKVSDILLNVLSPKTLENNVNININNNDNDNDNDDNNNNNIINIKALFNDNEEEYLLEENRPNSV